MRFLNFESVNLMQMSIIIKKLFYNVVRSNIKWDVIISPPLRLLLNVWLWYRCQNRIQKYISMMELLSKCTTYQNTHRKSAIEKMASNQKSISHTNSSICTFFCISVFIPSWFLKMCYISKRTGWEKKNVFVIIALQLLFTWQKPYSRRSQMPDSTWMKLTYINRNWTAKLQVTLLLAYISWNKFC